MSYRAPAPPLQIPPSCLQRAGPWVAWPPVGSNPARSASRACCCPCWAMAQGSSEAEPKVCDPRAAEAPTASPRAAAREGDGGSSEETRCPACPDQGYSAACKGGIVL